MVENQHLDLEEIVRDSFDEDELNQLLTRLTELEPAELALALESMPLEQRLNCWLGLAPEDQIEALTHMRVDARENIFKQLDDIQLKTLVEEMEVDALLELLDELPQRLYDYACSRLDASQRRWLETALTYDEDQCGRYADHDLLILNKNARVRDAIRLFQTIPDDAEYQDTLFVIDRTGRYAGQIQASSLLGRASHLPIEGFIDEDSPVVDGQLDLDQGSEIVARSGYTALAVVDADGKLLGRLSIGEALENVRRSLESQFMHTAGLDEEEDLFAPVLISAKRRAVWLGINLLTAFLAAWTIGLFEATLQQVVALAVLMPIVASMGGIAGSQTLTLMIRGLALEQITEQTYMTLLRKEMGVAAINGVLWSVVIAVITYLWFGDWLIGGIIGLAIVINIIIAAVSGVYIPRWLDKLNIDPALSGSVILTTVTDVVGFFAFLGLGSLFLLA
ncbi:magnesium transporter [Alishewanella longhuensis]|uniref:Magnesium transporter n=1 Tax=Alishewanella longhuensis TaxID=1091037 RepID=A0ABQ3KVS9_9ALTE|nr:magnesium transporter [Alishewanella longhuensis]GHG63883.1 magnesium transporter [Alishewanella longhuensis]